VGPPLSPSLLAAIAQTPLHAQFTPKTLIGSRYRVQALLGRGGAGEVYEAWDEELAIPVALKTLHFGGALGSDALRRLKQEAMLARAVVHPNVCRVYDLGCHGDLQNGVWFLTMEVLRGETLAEHLRGRGRLAPDAVWPIVEQMAAGLEAAHQSGVVHLDFKSANVMLVGESGQEQAVITDFGLARTVRQIHEETAASPTEEIVGTPAYMAPEQVRGEPAGPAADIYALGIVLYELVTGTLPFVGATELEVARRRLEADAPSPRTIVPELDERWETVISRCLEREPRRRFARATDVAEALAGRFVAEAATLQSAASILHSLPFERDRFVGREDELAALERALGGGARLVTLLGTGGMGKTRLAVHHGWRNLADWPGGVWFCDLTEARDVNGIVAAMGKSLGMRLGAGDPIEQLGHAISDRGRCLAILDNSEQVVGQVAAIVQRWVELTSEAAFMITSRERLGSSQETVVDIGPLGMDAGHELFIERAHRLRPGIELGPADLAAASEVVRLAEGMPLAIELAAARVRVMSVAQIATAMQKRFRLLTGGPSERHETLAAAIDGSWELLQTWEKAALAQCSVFEGGFTLEAAESVLDLTAYPSAPWAVDVVQSLVDKSLLRTMGARAEVERQPTFRIGMYVSLQEYARGKLAEDGAIPGGSGAEGVRNAEERHGRWYARYGTDDALLALSERGGVERRRALVREHENLLAATRRAAERGDGEVTTATYRAAAAVSSAQGPFGTIVDLGKAILDGQLLPKQRALVLRVVAKAERESGRTEEALEHYTTALAIHREQRDQSGESLTLGNMGNVYLDQGRMEEAIKYLEGALSIDRERGSQTGQGILLHSLGTVYQNLGRLTEARSYLESALAIHRETGSRRSEATAITSLGSLDCDQGRLEEGRSQLEAALDIYLELDDREGESNARRLLGFWHRVKGSLEDAARHTERTLAISRDMGNRPREAVVLHDLANLCIAEGRMEEARDHAEAALVVARETSNRRLQGAALGTLGYLFFEQGQTATAMETMLAGEALLREAKADPELGDLLYLRIKVEHGSGNTLLARTLLGEMEAIADRMGLGPDTECRRVITELRAMLS
jgi:predicted ATPase/tetratricopeptide (TPR) repeat protein